MIVLCQKHNKALKVADIYNDIATDRLTVSVKPCTYCIEEALIAGEKAPGSSKVKHSKPA